MSDKTNPLRYRVDLTVLPRDPNGNPNFPDLRGKGEINGLPVDIAAWINKDNAGHLKNISLSITLLHPAEVELLETKKKK